MKLGKVSEAILRRSVFKQLEHSNNELWKRAEIGVDYSGMSISSDEELIFTTNPFTIKLEYEDMGKYALINNINNLVCSGARPIGAEVSIMLPERTREAGLKKIMAGVRDEADKNKMQILGGNTQVTNAVNQPVISINAIGKRAKVDRTLQGKAGMDIVMTKWAGISATTMLAKVKREQLCERYPEAMLDKAASYEKYLSVREEAEIATALGDSIMHDVSEGGVFGALWELMQMAGTGLDVDIMKIPLKQETVEICEFYGLNPYEISSMGSLLILTNEGNRLISELERAGISGIIIGRTTDSADRIIHNDGEERYLEPARSDEIYSVL